MHRFNLAAHDGDDNAHEQREEDDSEHIARGQRVNGVLRNNREQRVGDRLIVALRLIEARGVAHQNGGHIDAEPGIEQVAHA